MTIRYDKEIKELQIKLETETCSIERKKIINQLQFFVNQRNEINRERSKGIRNEKIQQHNSIIIDAIKRAMKDF